MDDELGEATVVDLASGFDDTALSQVDIPPIGDITDTALIVQPQRSAEHKKQPPRRP
jgi:hypothetical protein